MMSQQHLAPLFVLRVGSVFGMFNMLCCLNLTLLDRLSKINQLSRAAWYGTRIIL